MSVDSMAVYRGMDIGTAKPTEAVRARVRYHLVDLVEPSDEFTVRQFQLAAQRTLVGIGERGNRALLVGGTGLYLRSVVDDLEIPGRFPDVAEQLAADLATTGPSGSAGERAELVQAAPAAGRTRSAGCRSDRALQPAPAAPGPRGDHRLRTALLVVRPRARAVPAEPGGPDRDPSRPGRARPQDRRPVRPVDGPGAPRRGPCPGGPARRSVAHGAARPWATASCSATSRTGCRWPRRWTRPSAGPGRSPAASWPGSGGIPVSCGCTPTTIRWNGSPPWSATHRGGPPGWENDGERDTAIRQRPVRRPAPAHEAPRRRQRLPGARGPGRHLAPRSGAGASGVRPPLRHRGRRCHPGDPRRRPGRPRHGAAQRRRRRGGDERQWDPVPGPGGGGGGPGAAHQIHRPHPGRGEVGGVPARRGRRRRRGLGGHGPGCGRPRAARGVRRVGRPVWSTWAIPTWSCVDPEVAGTDVERLGRQLQAGHPDGVNVEFIAIGPGPDTITLRVWERGAGETLACGSGSAAAAAAAHRWGLVGERVAVHNPGGTLLVSLEADGIRLEGPVRRVATLVVDRAELLGRGPAMTPNDSAFTDTLISRTVRERIVLVGVTFPPGTLADTEAALDELALLVDTAGADVMERIVQRRTTPDPATYLGRGKAEELLAVCLAVDADTVVFDDDLSPAQQRNLEKILGRTAIDRTAVILDIFAQNARTPEGRAQVELALLRYRLPRLRGRGRSFSQQAGGIGTRGPGETALEVDRRRLVRRMSRLESDLRQLERTRRTQRKGRAPLAPADGVPGRLHQRREVHPAQPVVRRRRAGREPAVLDARPTDPPARPTGWGDRAADRHRGLRPEAAPPGGGGVPVHPGDRGGVGPGRPRGRRIGPGLRGPGRRGPGRAGGDRGRRPPRAAGRQQGRRHRRPRGRGRRGGPTADGGARRRR